MDIHITEKNLKFDLQLEQYLRRLPRTPARALGDDHLMAALERAYGELFYFNDGAAPHYNKAVVEVISDSIRDMKKEILRRMQK